MEQMVSLSKLSIKNAAGLTDILFNDALLAKANGSKLVKISPQKFLDETNQWQIETNSESYSITLGESSIGLISLSHIDGTSAGAGCWIASNQWHKGYGTQAFKLLLDIAKQRGIKTINSTINLDNVASLRIWEKDGAEIDMSGEKAKATINLLT